MDGKRPSSSGRTFWGRGQTSLSAVRSPRICCGGSGIEKASALGRRLKPIARGIAETRILSVWGTIWSRRQHRTAKLKKTKEDGRGLGDLTVTFYPVLVWGKEQGRIWGNRTDCLTPIDTHYEYINRCRSSHIMEQLCILE